MVSETSVSRSAETPAMSFYINSENSDFLPDFPPFRVSDLSTFIVSNLYSLSPFYGVKFVKSLYRN